MSQGGPAAGANGNRDPDGPWDPNGPRDPGGPWDPGLQPERTALAWQRTGLATAVASLVAFRDGLVTANVPALALSVVAFLAAAWVLRASRTELDARVQALRAGSPLPAPTATPAAAAAVLALGGAVLCLVLG